MEPGSLTIVLMYDEGREADGNAGAQARRAGRRNPPADPSVVVMRAAVPIEGSVADKVAARAARFPLLLVVEPVTPATLVARWAQLARQLHERGIAVPALAEPGRLAAVLPLVTGENLVHLSGKRNQWAYLAAVHWALGTLSLVTARTLRADRPGRRPSPAGP
jgi:hypothetical protein